MTTREYKGYTIEHLHGTGTFKIYDKCGELVACVGTLAKAKARISEIKMYEEV